MGFVEIVVRSGDEAVEVRWVRESAFRFFTFGTARVAQMHSPVALLHVGVSGRFIRHQVVPP